MSKEMLELVKELTKNYNPKTKPIKIIYTEKKSV